MIIYIINDKIIKDSINVNFRLRNKRNKRNITQ